MGKFTNYDSEVKDGLQVENVRTVVTNKFADFPLDKFPHYWRSPFGKKDQRLYARKGYPEFFCGISSLASSCGITDKSGLNKARVQLAFQGIDSDIKWNERANYGSCLHLLIALHERGELRFVFGEHDWVEVAEDFIQEFGYHSLRAQWINDLQNDMASYFSWKKDNKVEVIATEIMVAHEEWHVATPIDLLVEMDFNRKRIKADINIKSGDTHPFSEDYYFQVALETYLYNRQIGKSKYQAEGAFLWRPKTRATTPGKYEMSKNAINAYGLDDFEFAARWVERKKPYIPSADSKIVTYRGTEEDVKVVISTPYEWLARINGIEGF